MLLGEPRRTHDRAVLGDVGLDLLDLRRRVAERLQRQRHRAIDDRHLATTDELFELDKRKVRLHAGGVGIEQKRDRPSRRQHGGLRVSISVLLAARHSLVPRPASRSQQVGVLAGVVDDLIACVTVHPHHRVVRVAVLGVPLVRSHRLGNPRRRRIGAPGHQRSDCRSGSAAGV